MAILLQAGSCPTQLLFHAAWERMTAQNPPATNGNLGRNLLDDHNSKELSLEWALHRFWALSKCQFGDTVDEATQCAFLRHLLP